MPTWWNGRHKRLKISGLNRPCQFESGRGYQIFLHFPLKISPIIKFLLAVLGWRGSAGGLTFYNHLSIFFIWRSPITFASLNASKTISITSSLLYFFSNRSFSFFETSFIALMYASIIA